MQDEEVQAKRRKKIIWFSSITGFFVLLAVIFLIYWFSWGRYYNSTDDAYVHGNIVNLNAQVSGIVTQINCDNTQLVQQGDVLIELDTTDALIALKRSESELAETVRMVSDMFQKVYQVGSELESKRAELQKAEAFFWDRERLVPVGAVSQENFIQSFANYKSLEFEVLAKTFELKRAIILVKKTTVRDHPLVQKAAENLKRYYVDYKRCYIPSPVTGIVAKRSAQVGESIDEETPLLAVVPLDEIWVDANYKEIHLKKIRIGQPVTIKSDIYKNDVIYRGRVIGIGAGTGEVFSPLPPQNATGNWIKIVQRVPVRVSIDSDQLIRYPLRLGLSMRTTIDVHNQRGPRLPEAQPLKALYETEIYEEQVLGADKLIESIISDNIGFIGSLDDHWIDYLDPS